MAEAFVDYKSKSKKRADWAILKQLFYADQTIGPYNKKNTTRPPSLNLGRFLMINRDIFLNGLSLAATLAGMHERKKEN